MLTLGSKSFVGTSVIAAVAAAAYGGSTSDVPGTVLLMLSIFAAAFMAYAVLNGAGAADQYSYEGGADVRPARDPKPTIVPFVAALGAGIVGLGFALGAAGFVAGGLIAAVALIVWFAQSWRDHPDYTPKLSERVSDSVGLPFGMPIVLLAIIGFIAVGMSRTLLAVTQTQSWVIALIVGAVFFFSAVAISVAPKVSRRVVTAAIAAVVAVVAGLAIYGAVKGERKFGHHEGGEEHALVER